jgi:hypothetical protein
MIDFGDDTAGECFIVLHRQPSIDPTHRLMPVNPRRGPAGEGLLARRRAFFRLLGLIGFGVDTGIRSYPKHLAHRAISALYRLRKC